jgi:hypothetical protein
LRKSGGEKNQYAEKSDTKMNFHKQKVTVILGQNPMSATEI